MGDQVVSAESSPDERRAFMRQVLNDLHALERMIEEGLIESDVRRIGAEQEMFLIDRNFRPSSSSMGLLDDINDPHFTTELGLFNLEVNLDPLRFEGGCLSQLEKDIEHFVGKARASAKKIGVDIALTGILPTLRKSDLSLDNLTPLPRYKVLDDAMNALRGDAYAFHIMGVDELLVKHDSVMLEACNASFQLHYQVSAEEFANLYNIAQVVAGPVLAAAVNSPILFGRQLWRETRIALFQQSVDTRVASDYLRDRSPRVSFGKGWLRKSILELFKEDISRFPTIVSTGPEEDSMAALDRSEAPKLRSLCAHNGTVYRWNRPCYGISNGKPHLRIENRLFAAGPTIQDEVANAALWFGLLAALSARYDDITQLISFDDAKMNFRSAARLGLGASFQWLNGESIPGPELICSHCVPLAEEGLVKSGVDPADAKRYLSIIDRRAARRHTGADWIVASLSSLRGRGGKYEQLQALTAALVSRQYSGAPVADWDEASPDEKLAARGAASHRHLTVEQYMSTDLLTVGEEDSLDLVLTIMDWKNVRHVPVEDKDQRLVGLVSYWKLIRLMAAGKISDAKPIPVADVMKRDLTTLPPTATTLEAIETMRKHKIACIPILSGERLIGILSERDLMDLAAELLEQNLSEETAAPAPVVPAES